MHPTDQILIQQNSYDTKDSRLANAPAERVICLLLPAAAVAAAMTSKGFCLSVRYSRFDKSRPWEASFFEKVLGNELMIRSRNATKAVFTSTDKQLLIPDSIYQQEAAQSLLRDIYHIAPDEYTGQTPCKTDKAHMVFAYDHAVPEIAGRHMEGAEIKPLNICQFQKTEKLAGHSFNCLLTEREAYCTLRHDGKLLWHHNIIYSSAADITFHLLHACREWGIERKSVHLQCMAVHPQAMETIISGLHKFFPNIYAGREADQEWAPVIYLLQQLNLCVS